MAVGPVGLYLADYGWIAGLVAGDGYVFKIGYDGGFSSI